MKIIGKTPTSPFEEMLLGILARSIPGSTDAQAARAAAIGAAVSAEMTRRKLIVVGLDDLAGYADSFVLTGEQIATPRAKAAAITLGAQKFAQKVGAFAFAQHFIRGGEEALPLADGPGVKVTMRVDFFAPGRLAAVATAQANAAQAMAEAEKGATHAEGGAA